MNRERPPARQREAPGTICQRGCGQLAHRGLCKERHLDPRPTEGDAPARLRAYILRDTSTDGKLAFDDWLVVEAALATAMVESASLAELRVRYREITCPASAGEDR